MLCRYCGGKTEHVVNVVRDAPTFWFPDRIKAVGSFETCVECGKTSIDRYKREIEEGQELLSKWIPKQ